MAARPADADILPTDYSPDRVIGISREGGRPTVFFDDYSRFVQVHHRQQVIGFHLPPLEQILFTNMDFNTVKYHRLMLDQWPPRDPRRVAYARSLADKQKDGERLTGARLFELKLLAGKDGGIVPEISGASFEQIGMGEAKDILARVRRLGPEKERIGLGRSRFWVFAER